MSMVVGFENDGEIMSPSDFAILLGLTQGFHT